MTGDPPVQPGSSTEPPTAQVKAPRPPRQSKKKAAAPRSTKVRLRTSTFGFEVGDTIKTDAATAAHLVAERLVDPA